MAGSRPPPRVVVVALAIDVDVVDEVDVVEPGLVVDVVVDPGSVVDVDVDVDVVVLVVVVVVVVVGGVSRSTKSTPVTSRRRNSPTTGPGPILRRAGHRAETSDRQPGAAVASTACRMS